MASTFFGLNIATSSLFAAQAGLQTTLHNMSNENTKGYSRQEVKIESAGGMSFNRPHGLVGLGVNVTGIEQVRNSYYDKKYQTNEGKLQEQTIKATYTMEIEELFNEVTVEGFTKEYENLFNTMSSLQGTPADLTYRAEFLSYAQSVATYFNDIQSKLADLQKEANADVKNQMDRINALTADIASVNHQISAIELSGRSANDLRDKRMLYIDELSSIIPVEISETDPKDGTSHFTLKSCGYPLITDNEAKELIYRERENQTNPYDIDGIGDVYIYYNEENDSCRKLDVQGLGQNGYLRALLDVRDGNGGLSETTPIGYKGIPYYYEKLQEFKTVLGGAFNSIHQDTTRIDEQGNEVPANYNLYGDSTKDIPIFVFDEQGNMNVNKALLDDPRLLATSTRPIREGLENSELLRQMIEIKDAKLFRRFKADEYLQSITAEIAIDTKKAEKFELAYTDIKETITNQRMSVSGVDGDEEAMNMVKFQEMFDLASKMITVMSEIYNKLINETGW